jgi:glycosyltransferase involved in cell wall biosynthesis
VAQKGSRENFLAARALHKSGMLSAMFVDWYPKKSILNRLLQKSKSRHLSRAFSVCAPDIPDELIRPFNWTGLIDRLYIYISRFFGKEAELVLKGDIRFSKKVSASLDLNHNAYFGYSYSSLEAMRVEKEKGNLCVLDQIDPGEREHEIIYQENSKWPNYVQSTNQRVPQEVYERLHEEWKLADIILVNSEWSKTCNVEKGAPKEKIHIIPLAFENTHVISNIDQILDTVSSNFSENQLVRILWVGRVTLQKGIQYLVEAALLLQDQPVEFLVAGDVSISLSAMKRAPSNIRWLGKVSHSKKQELLQSSTSFVLPTLSDGFAMTQLEAMSSGLPVIVSPNCGRVVEEGKTGFIIPPRDPGAIADAIKRFIDDPYLKQKMSRHCLNASKKYTIDAYSNNLLKAIHSIKKIK